MREAMKWVRWRTGGRIIGAALLVLAVSGCAVVQLAYNQAPAWTSWWINSYADLDDDQGPRAREAIDAFFRWHRSTQLPEYAAMLTRMQAQAQDNTSAAALCRWEPELRQKAEVALMQTVVPVADLAVTLTPQQLRHIDKRYERNNKEFREEYLQPDPKERREELLDKTVERLEKLYGRLDGPQRERVAQALMASPFDPEQWYQERVARQRDTLQTLRSLKVDGRAVPAAQAQAAVRDLMGRWLHSPRPAYEAYQRRLVDYNCAWMAELHNSTTPAQRKAARDKLRGWADDARALATSND